MLDHQIDLTQQAARAASGFAGRAEVACAGRAPSCFSALPVHSTEVLLFLSVQAFLLLFLQEVFGFLFVEFGFVKAWFFGY